MQEGLHSEKESGLIHLLVAQKPWGEKGQQTLKLTLWKACAADALVIQIGPHARLPSAVGNFIPWKSLGDAESHLWAGSP